VTVTRSAVTLDGFAFESGDRLDLTVAYEAHGDPADPTVLLCHALTGSAHVARGDADDADWWDSSAAPDDGPAGQADAWWDDLVGPGRPIDTDRYHVVCPNVPGSCYGTTGPASVDPATGDPYGPDFPPVTVGDWVESGRRLLDELGVDGLHAVVGGSVGGMAVLEWARRYPDVVDRIAPIAAGPRLDAQGVALTALGRRAIVTDPQYRGGRYYGAGPDPDEGLAQARALAHVTYRSKTGMDRRLGRDRARGRAIGPFGADPFDDDPTASEDGLAVESYLQDRAASFVDRFDANAYLALTRAMERYDLAARAADDADALSAFDGAALTLSISSDWLFPPDQVRDLTAALRTAGVRTVHESIESDRGHDAFLAETDAVGDALGSFLDGDRAADRRGRRDTRGSRGAPVHASLLSG